MYVYISIHTHTHLEEMVLNDHEGLICQDLLVFQVLLFNIVRLGYSFNDISVFGYLMPNPLLNIFVGNIF